jgi:hypothetical protein
MKIVGLLGILLLSLGLGCSRQSSHAPAIDPEFRTIDFLTLVDLHHIPDRLRTRFF